MVLEIKAVQTEYVASNSELKEKTAPNSIIEAAGVLNSTSDNKVKTDTNEQDKINEIYKKFNNIAKEYNLSESDLKKIIENVSEITVDKLIKADEKQINELINLIQNAIKILKYKKEDTNVVSIITNAKKTKIMTDNGWTMKGAMDNLKNSRQENLADKLRRVYPTVFTANYDFTDPQNREEIKKYVAHYTKTYHKSEKTACTDLAKMLANTSNDAERDMFDGILKEINPEYKAQFVKSWLYSYDNNDNRIKAANRTYENIIELTNNTNKEQTEEIAHTIRSYQDKDGIIKSDKKLYAIFNKYFEEQNIKDIIEKQKKFEKGEGEALTEKEQSLYDEWLHYQSIITGSITGTIANKNVDDDFKNSHLHNFVNPNIYNYGEYTYKEILKDINEFYNSHSDEFNMTAEEFNSFMNNVTDNNYSNVISDNNTSLNPPSTQTESQAEPQTTTVNTYNNSETVSGALGFDNNTTRPNTPAKIESLAIGTTTDNENKIKNSNNTDELLDKIGNNPEELEKYASEVGTFAFVTNILNSKCSKGTLALNMALDKFKNMCNALQRLALANIHNFSNAVKAAYLMTIDQLNTIKKGNTIYLTEKLKYIKAEKEKTLGLDKQEKNILTNE